MTSSELRHFLDSQRLSQAEFSRLIGVTPGATAQWLSNNRSIPPTVSFIVKLLCMMSLDDRERLYREATKVRSKK